MPKDTTIFTHNEDLPSDVTFNGDIAIDTETMGLQIKRDRLCVVQLSDGGGTAHLVKFNAGSNYSAPNLKKILADDTRTKLFHFARFDLASIYYYLHVMPKPVYCTRTASRLARTYTGQHGLQHLCAELLDISLDKQKQSSDWGQDILDDAQQHYAASDVLYLHALREKLDTMLHRENRYDLAKQCFDFLPSRALLDIQGWAEIDIFAHT